MSVEILTAVVGALTQVMLTESWQAARGRFVRLLGRPRSDQDELNRRLDHSRQMITSARWQDRTEAQDRVAAIWMKELLQSWQDSPGLIREATSFLDFVAGLDSTRSDTQVGIAAGGDQANVAGSAGRDQVGIQKIDGRKHRWS